MAVGLGLGNLCRPFEVESGMSGLLTLLIALVLGLFGAGDGLGEGGAVAAGPGEPPPGVPVPGDAPPPAWIETERGSFWLAYSGFCWETRCIKAGAGREDIPTLVLRRGENVRLHLGFEPGRVTLGDGRGRPVRLEPGRTTSWRVVDGADVLSLFAQVARGEPGGSAGYLAVVELR